MTWLGLLNFLVLQWFGLRLARVCRVERYFSRGDVVGPLLLRMGWISRDDMLKRHVTVGWKLLRWVWPLTGWWSDYRWIARRP